MLLQLQNAPPNELIVHKNIRFPVKNEVINFIQNQVDVYCQTPTQTEICTLDSKIWRSKLKAK
jgi:hypothetical protein